MITSRVGEKHRARAIEIGVGLVIIVLGLVFGIAFLLPLVVGMAVRRYGWSVRQRNAVMQSLRMLQTLLTKAGFVILTAWLFSEAARHPVLAVAGGEALQVSARGRVRRGEEPDRKTLQRCRSAVVYALGHTARQNVATGRNSGSRPGHPPDR